MGLEDERDVRARASGVDVRDPATLDHRRHASSDDNVERSRQSGVGDDSGTIRLDVELAAPLDRSGQPSQLGQLGESGPVTARQLRTRLAHRAGHARRRRSDGGGRLPDLDVGGREVVCRCRRIGRRRWRWGSCRGRKRRRGGWCRHARRGGRHLIGGCLRQLDRSRLSEDRRWGVWFLLGASWPHGSRQKRPRRP